MNVAVVQPVPPIFVFLIIAAVVGVIWWAVVVGGRRTQANLSAVANRLGLQLEIRRWMNLVIGGSLHGTVQGRRVRFWSYTTGSGKSQTTWAAVGVIPRQDGGLEFKLSRQGLATKVMELFGSKEVTVGDRAFDEAWFVQTNRPDYLAAALVPEIREKLMAAHRAGGGGSFRLDGGGEVVYVEQGSLSSAKVIARLEGVLPVLQDLADVAEVAEARAGG